MDKHRSVSRSCKLALHLACLLSQRHFHERRFQSRRKGQRRRVDFAKTTASVNRANLTLKVKYLIGALWSGQQMNFGFASRALWERSFRFKMLTSLKSENAREMPYVKHAFCRASQYVLSAMQPGTLVVFLGTYKFEEIARIQILFDADPKTCLFFQSRFAWSAAECAPQPSENFSRKVFQDDSTKTGRKIRFAASGFRNFSSRVTGRWKNVQSIPLCHTVPPCPSALI